MKRCTLLLICAIFAAQTALQAQTTAAPSLSNKSSEDTDKTKDAGDEKGDSEDEDKESEDGDGEDKDSEPSAPPPPKVLEGDIITFKSGKVLSSVQVIRESVTGLEVEILPGMPSLKIPMDQIESIKRDDIDPTKRKRRRGSDAADATPGVMTAEELNPDLSRKLTTPLAPEDLVLQGHPILDTLTALSAKIEVPLSIKDPVRALDPASLIWQTNPAENTTFLILLQDILPKSASGLSVIYAYNEVTLTTQEDAAANAQPPAAPGEPAAPEAGGPATPPGTPPPPPGPGPIPGFQPPGGAAALPPPPPPGAPTP